VDNQETTAHIYRCPGCSERSKMMIQWPMWRCPLCHVMLIPADDKISPQLSKALGAVTEEDPKSWTGGGDRGAGSLEGAQDGGRVAEVFPGAFAGSQVEASAAGLQRPAI
jgi:hypothetical protein